MSKTHFFLLAAMIFGIASTTPVQAQAQDGVAAQPVASARPADSANVPMTSEDLRELLISLPTQKTQELSEDFWLLHLLCNGKTIVVFVSRSPDGIRIWNTFRLAKIPSDFPAEQLGGHLAKLLLVNGTAGDFFFSLDDDMTVNLNGCLHVHKKVEKDELLAHLGQMARIVVEQESLWNPALWNREKPKHVGQW